ncbi:MAG: DUF3754 domain-containing protein [Bacteroidetes bacterium]|nr:DUF3754 domain-containing protein [Bacteroidota bacterium]
MKREQYIPFDKEFLLDLQIAERASDKKDTEDFKKMFDILEHYFHYEAFNLIRNLKQNYSAFDPDLNRTERAAYNGKSDLSIFKKTLLTVLERGNYNLVDKEVLDEAFKNSDLIGLKIGIDFDDFKEYGLYVRGHNKSTEKLTKYFFWKKETTFEYYDRVMIYLKYNDTSYFEENKINISKLPFEPGCIVLKIFKRVPKNDLETIFPNAVPKMSLIDKLLLWVPGFGGGISLLSAKVIPALIAMYTTYKAGNSLNSGNSKTALTQGLLALGILCGYLFRQYNNFVNKKIKFSKMLSDSLYFKNLGNNSGAFYSLLNSSEEEELKETILAYAFLNKSKQSLTAEELDLQIESWFKTYLNTELDFDVEDALYKLKNIGLGYETNGKWEVIPLNKALIRIDEIWDGIFDYNQNQ